jgi:hypothetical protein
MVTCLDDRIVNTRNGWARTENAQGNGNLPPPSSLTQAIASILESRDEQTELLRQLVANYAHGGNGARNAPGVAPTTYLGCYVAQRCRRLSSPRNSCVVTSARVGQLHRHSPRVLPSVVD